ncbi:MAG: hypothetical protein ACRD6X_13990 [Pyrinomonadaceae bacterium]
MQKANHSNLKAHARKPFWLPALSFYFLVTGIAAAIFFLVILLFHDGVEEYEWVSAGLVSSGVLIAGVILREVLLRSVRERHIMRRNLLDRNVRRVSINSGEYNLRPKFTLEQNTAALETVRTKSEAAKVFGRIAAGHLEVFDLCVEYLRIVADEIPRVHPESPRLGALKRGYRFAADLQRFHLLKWAEIEASANAAKAASAASIEDKLAFNEAAKNVIEFAARFYPEDSKLNESMKFIEESAVQAKIGGLIDDGDKAAAENDHESAGEHYTAALELLNNSDSNFAYKQLFESIEQKIRALQKFEN